MGKISRIQLRGISRTPSDRITKDGGCAESLNAYLDSEELAPAIRPDDMTEAVGLPAGENIKKVFIHKTLTTETYVVITLSPGNRYVLGTAYKGALKHILTFDDEEVYKDITSIGNTLIIATDKRMLYYLYKDGEYINLGDGRIGVSMSFVNIGAPTFRGDSRFDENANLPWKEKYTGYDSKEKELLFGDAESGYVVASGEGVGAVQQIWETYQEMIGHNMRLGCLNNPIMLRYAVTLYDGSYLEVSPPILLGPAFNESGEPCSDPAYVYWSITEGSSTEDYPYGHLFLVHLRDPYKIGFYKYCEEKRLEKFRDIIKSVDIFASPIIDVMPDGNKAARSEMIDPPEGDWYRRIILDPATLESDEKTRDCFLKASTFYKVKSFSLDDIARSTGGEAEILDIDFTGENVYTNGEILDETKVGNSILSHRISSYNNSLIAEGGKIIIPSGLPSMNGAHAYVGSSSSQMAFRYRIPTQVSGELISYSRNYQNRDSVFVSPKLGEVIVDIGNQWPYNQAYAEPMTFISFPDSRCDQVDICYGNSVASVEMKPHPYIPNCAYAWLGINSPLKNLRFSGTVQNSFEDDVPENRLDRADNKLMFSLMDNPFTFPLVKRHTFQADILGVAVASTTLSQGQFGQFPLYVFTKDGIWAMEAAGDGSLLSAKPVSREVCCNKDSITPLDQSVIFVSNKGLMMIQGAEVTNLSPYMNGRHWTIEPVAETILRGQTHFCNFADTLKDPTSFMAFMENALIGYDYAVHRLVCINPNEAYQYVYMLNTQTWHRIQHEEWSMIAPLNSYPKCEVFARTTNAETKEFRLLDFSTVLDDSREQTPEKVVVATRPLDLDEPDVLKTITDVRIRGQFPKKAVKFILQGSQDGINFYTISTLRGKAWKMFRLILLADLGVHDRISWVDIMYDSRFTNKLR